LYLNRFFVVVIVFGLYIQDVRSLAGLDLLTLGSYFLAARTYWVSPLIRRCCGTAATQIDRVAAAPMSFFVPSTTFIGRQSLNNTIACQHSPIDRKVPAYHECSHGRILLSQTIGLVCEICLVLPTIHKHKTGITR